MPRDYPVPPQYFRPESFTWTSLGGSTVAVGTLWVVVWTGGKRTIIRERNHPVPLHHMNLERSTGKHDLHLRLVPRETLAEELGKNTRFYADVIQQMQMDGK